MRDAQKYRKQAARLREEAYASSDLEVVELLNDVAALPEAAALPHSRSRSPSVSHE